MEKPDASEIAKLTEEINQLSKKIDDANAELKADLEGQITVVQDELAETNKKLEQANAEHATKEELKALETKVSELSQELTRVTEALNLAIDANAQNIVKLQQQLSRLSEVEGKVFVLEQFEKEVTAFLGTTTKDYRSIMDFVDAKLAEYTKSTLDPVIRKALQDAVESDGTVNKYVSSAIETLKAELMVEISAVSNDLATTNTKLEELTKDYDAFIVKYNANYVEVFQRLADLEQWKLQIARQLPLLEGSISANADQITAAFNKILEIQGQLGSFATTSEMNGLIDQTKLNLKSYVNNEVTAINSSIEEVKADLAKLNLDVDAIGKILQNVVYIPSSMDGTEEFISFYAKQNKEADYEIVSKSENIKVRFRVSPASAIKTNTDLEDYVIGFDGQLYTRSASAFEFVSAKVLEAGVIEVTMKAGDAVGSQSVALTIDSKNAVGNDDYSSPYKTSITSNYFPVEMSTYYLSDAKVALTDAGVQNGGIIYDDNTSKLDYSKVGNIQLGVFTSEASIEWGAPTYKDLSQFAGCVDFSKFSMEYTVTNTDKLQIDKAGIVTLKKYGVPSYLETPNTGIVSAFAKSTAYYLVGGNSATDLGTVTITFKKKTATVAYEDIKLAWAKDARTKELATSTIYNDPKVLITKSEFEQLTGKATVGTTNVKFVVDNDTHTLKVEIAEKAPAGTYNIEAVYSSDEREITVKEKVIIADPKFDNLQKDDHFWTSDNFVILTPTFDQTDKPSTINLNFDLSKLFTNYDEVKEAIEDMGGVVKLDVVKNGAKGLDYSSPTTLKYDKTAYEAGAKQPQIVATITFGGKEYTKIVGTIDMTDLSGTWTAPTTRAIVLSDKNITYDISEGFVWKDKDNRIMWKDGAVVKDAFAEDVDPLKFYGLSEPTYEFVDKDGKKIETVYLEFVENSPNKVQFAVGQDFEFFKDEVIYVKVIAESRWGEIANYNSNNIIKLTIPAKK
ncbi:hypothetical protein NXV57_25795 [Bacteroides thetaiotaomicron]|nr:hypothetical protein [Bacteroides thetaiotaomicron]